MGVLDLKSERVCKDIKYFKEDFVEPYKKAGILRAPAPQPIVSRGAAPVNIQHQQDGLI